MSAEARSYIIPVARIPQDTYVKLIKDLETKVLARAAELIKGEPLAIRALMPKDFGLNTPSWTFNLAAGTNSNVVNVELKDKFLVAIIGIFNRTPSPNAMEVVFRTPQKTLADVALEDMYNYDVYAGILADVVIYPPGSTVQIDIVAKAANPDERLGFLGFVVTTLGNITLPAKK